MVKWLERCPGLHAVAPIPTSGLHLFLIVLDSTSPHFVNSKLVASCQLGFVIMFLLSLNCSVQIIKKRAVCKLQSWTKRAENIKNRGYFAHYVLNIAHY